MADSSTHEDKDTGGSFLGDKLCFLSTSGHPDCQQTHFHPCSCSISS